MSVAVRVAACVLAAAAAGAFGGARADDLLYYVDAHGQVVFTNTASRKDARPVPFVRGAPAQRLRDLPATPYDRYIDEVSRKNGIDLSLVKAVALVESGFDPHAVSRAGATGIMQLMPDTAKRYGVTDRRNPYQSLDAGARHLRDLLDSYDGDVSLALAAYNAGPGAVKRYGGVPAYPETQDYVRRVQATMGRPVRTRGTRTLAARTEKIDMHVEADGSITLSN